MTDQTLLSLLSSLECALHRPEDPAQPGVLAALLHGDFLEFGRSGGLVRRVEALPWLSGASGRREIVACDFALQWATETAALLTYRSSERDEQGHVGRHTLRSSLWLKGPQGWQMRFHQGTPTSAGGGNADS
ncbi:hypothetical protein THUN1379_14460 [Paludibacterium sp. THUN1379]|uniref:nuclear transport factor 2 family protein n=1 Tax=Paludibacterium sp. THUN1379 TaxID=3112107 RepID=UPI003087C3B8|nr:hypothetical protein THUN1379_14460 [Paludibacterium sp. THUN1379]